MFELQLTNFMLTSLNIRMSYRLGMFELQPHILVATDLAPGSYRLGMFELQPTVGLDKEHVWEVIAWACLSCN